MKLPGFLLFILALSLSSPAIAQDPAALKNQANTQVVTASRLMEKAFEILRQAPAAQGRDTAVSLLVEAGQMFEQSAGIYKALVPDYAAQEDVENSLRAMQVCIQKIQEIKQAS